MTLEELIKDCVEEENAHLALKDIRDVQQERLQELMREFPDNQILKDFWDDFMVARQKHHETLLAIRRRRLEVLQQWLRDVF